MTNDPAKPEVTQAERFTQLCQAWFHGKPNADNDLAYFTANNQDAITAALSATHSSPGDEALIAKARNDALEGRDEIDWYRILKAAGRKNSDKARAVVRALRGKGAE